MSIFPSLLDFNNVEVGYYDGMETAKNSGFQGYTETHWLSEWGGRQIEMCFIIFH